MVLVMFEIADIVARFVVLVVYAQMVVLMVVVYDVADVRYCGRR